tara:strand:+ start:545 stop:757 length:213 start_codon:yes stop_codon:yes gene_type:complete
MKYVDQKYPLDKEVKINTKTWRIAEYRHRFGMQWVYILQHENVDGTYKILELNEKSLTEIIKSGSRNDDE